MNSIVSPCAMVDLRAQIEGDGNEAKVCAAFNIKGWKNGKKKLTQVEIAAYSNIPLRTLRRVLEGMISKGWLSRESGRDKVYIYEKTIEEMTWDEAHEICRARITGEPVQIPLIAKKSSGQNGQSKRPEWPEQAAKMATSNSIKDSSLRTSSKVEPGVSWNPFTDFINAFAYYKIEVTERNERHISILNARANKIGQDRFKRILKEYCTDEFIKRQGRSLNGLLNCFDRLLDKVKPSVADFKEVCKTDGHQPGKQNSHLNMCKRCGTQLGYWDDYQKTLKKD